MGKITEYPIVGSLDDNDKLFVNVDGHLRQIAKKDTGMSGGGGVSNAVKFKVNTWGTQLVVTDAQNINFVLLFGNNLYTIWIPSTNEVHLKECASYDDYVGEGSYTTRDGRTGIAFTVTREPSPSKRLTITSESNMTMCIWYS